jgi:hypothetical protein
MDYRVKPNNDNRFNMTGNRCSLTQRLRIAAIKKGVIDEARR